MNFGFYITLIFFSGFVFTEPLAAQSYPKLESRLVFAKPNEGQSFLNLDGAQVFSTFKFFSTNSNQNQSADNPAYSRNTGTAFSLGFEHIVPNGLFALAGIGLRKAGSSLIYNNTNYTWNMQYTDVKAGIGYQLNKWPLKPYAEVMPYYAYLMDAKQSSGTNYFDIKSDKSIKSNDFGLFMAFGFKASISPYISIYAEYNYILGLYNIETTPEQYLYNRGFSFKFGLALTLTNFIIPEKAIVQEQANLFADTTSGPSQTIAIPGAVGWKNNQEAAPAKTKITELGTSAVTSSAVSPPPVAPVTIVPITKDTTQKINIETASQNKSPDGPQVSPAIINAPVSGIPKDVNSSKMPKEKLARTHHAANSVSRNVVFKIQIAAVKSPMHISNSLLKKLTGKVEMDRGKDGYIRYYIGSFKNYEEAHAELNKIKSKGGAEGGFVVAFKKGKQVTLSEAKELVKQDY